MICYWIWIDLDDLELKIDRCDTEFPTASPRQSNWRLDAASRLHITPPPMEKRKTLIGEILVMSQLLLLKN